MSKLMSQLEFSRWWFEELTEEERAAIEMEVWGLDGSEDELAAFRAESAEREAQKAGLNKREMFTDDEFQSLSLEEISERSWKLFETLQDNMHQTGARCIDPDEVVVDPVIEFICSAIHGYHPAPDVTLAIALALNKYVAAAGELSLDEVFFGQQHKKKSSYAHNVSGDLEYSFFDSNCRREVQLAQQAGKKSPSLETIAEEHFRLNPGRLRIDIESFLRGFRRWKRAKEAS